MLEAVPISRIFICLGSGVLIITCPFLRKSPVFLLLSLLSMVLAYRQLAFAYALTSGAVFFFTAVLARLTISGDKKKDLRWRWSSMGLIRQTQKA